MCASCSAGRVSMSSRTPRPNLRAGYGQNQLSGRASSERVAPPRTDEQQGVVRMWEQSKAAKRRFNDGLFHARYFVGKGIDIGGGPDPLGQYAGVFARMAAVRAWDVQDGDAQLMAGVPEDEFDFVHSSHCLEHLHDPKAALVRWVRIVRPGGFLIVTVPDEDLYEKGHWPSRYNVDHKWTFTVHTPQSSSPRSLNVLDLLIGLSHLVEIERIALLRDFFRDELPAELDQT